MTETARKENYSTEVDNFLETLYGTTRGYVYSPVKDPQKQPDSEGYWQPYFFKWPQQREAIITHVLRSSELGDVYIAPSLFKAHNAQKEGWKGTNYVWIEFDGNAPKNTPTGIPSPTIRVQSSEQGHEHWYWKLQNFNTSIQEIEGLARQLTYTLDADKSGWDCGQVLRPPGSLHHESTRRVRLLTQSETAFSFSDFKNLVIAPEIVVTGSNFTELPAVAEVIAKYKWPTDEYELFQKQTIEIGSRSSAMTRLGFACIEMGMSNEECYVVLLNADDRWEKYKHRSPSDRAKRILGIVTHCRGKKLLDSELRLSDQDSFVSLGDFRNLDIKAKWLYQDFLTEQGLGIVSASPGVGKSTISFRLGFCTVLGKDFFVWRNVSKSTVKVGYVSLEMSSVEIKEFINGMLPSFTTEEIETLDNNFHLLPLGYSLPLGDKKHQQAMLDEIDKHEIKFLIIDSLKAATKLDESTLDKFFDWINKDVREKRGVTVWLVHHNRKPPNDTTVSRRPKDLGDLYGDTFITSHPTTVISLFRKSKNEIEVIPLKSRLAAESEPFLIKRTVNLNFDIIEKIKKEDAIDNDDQDSKRSLFGNRR